MKSFSSFISLILVCGATSAASACDACSLFVVPATEQRGYTLALSEQFTRFGSMWSGRTQLPNPVDQYLDSSITQLAAGFASGGKWRVQATLPYIQRDYLRPDHALIERGRVSGIGDVTLAGQLRAWHFAADEHQFNWTVLGGIELPTGNASHLGDEIGDDSHPHENFPDSGIHGHDLALGSGSTDYVLGSDVDWQRDRWFARVSFQYKLRRPGKFGYRIADEVSWEAGPGYYFSRSDTQAFSVQLLLSEEHKGFDTLGGELQLDTGFGARYGGVRVSVTRGKRFSGDASLELPTRIRTTETMIVPDYRLRASLSWRI